MKGTSNAIVVYHNSLQVSQIISIGFPPFEVDFKVSKSITPIDLGTVILLPLCLFIGEYLLVFLFLFGNPRFKGRIYIFHINFLDFEGKICKNLTFPKK